MNSSVRYTLVSTFNKDLSLADVIFCKIKVICLFVKMAAFLKYMSQLMEHYEIFKIGKTNLRRSTRTREA